jgi:crotonobetaine/carnitine-CoA ligase
MRTRLSCFAVRPPSGAVLRTTANRATRHEMKDIADLPSRLPPAERTLPHMLRRQAALYGGRRLVEIGAQAWSFVETLEMAARFGGTLHAAGIERGDHVAVMCGNRRELLQVYLGCGWIGAVTVPINTASRGVQLTHILANCKAKLLVLQAEFADAMDSLEIVPPSLGAIWLIGDAELGERWPRPARFPAPAEPVPAAEIGPGDTVAILYTSGTTGVSKGVCCPHAQYFWWGVNTARLLGLRGDDVLLTTLPLFHTNALNTFYQALLTGSALVVEPRFSASGFATSLSHHGATITYLLGAMVPILLSRPASELDRAQPAQQPVALVVQQQGKAPCILRHHTRDLVAQRGTRLHRRRSVEGDAQLRWHTGCIVRHWDRHEISSPTTPLRPSSGL